jgi:hypothetical protein
MTRYAALALLLTGMLLAAPPRPAHAQEAQRLEQAKAGLSAEAAASLEATIRTSRERGLPTEPLIVKALEGRAKGIAGDRIVLVVREMAERMGRAQIVLRQSTAAGAPPATAIEIAAVADALQRGVPEDAVRALRRGAPSGEPIDLSVHALADILEKGVPVAIGIDIIAAWRARGGRTADLPEIRATVARLVAQGVVPAQAGAAVAAGVRVGRGLGTIGPADIGAILGRGRGN